MIKITYPYIVLIISALWILIRAAVCITKRRISPRREAELILVYVCIIVVARFTFFPFSKVDGEIQPLIFDASRVFPPRINLVPVIRLFDYPKMSEALLNLIGNTTMFIPIGIIWPSVLRRLDTHLKVISAGVGFSLCIEVLQLLFFDRVTDIDDLLLNSLGFIIGYAIFLTARLIARAVSARVKGRRKNDSA